MDSIIKYDEKNGIICASYDDILCNVIEIDVTDQALQAVFRYLMAHGLSLAEHRTPTFEPVKRGKWVETSHKDKKRCSVCDRICFIAIYPWFFGMAHYCPACGAEMDGESE